MGRSDRFGLTSPRRAHVDQLPAFTCYACHHAAGNPHTSLDRRVLRRTGGVAPDGTACPTLDFLETQELFTYCDFGCWLAHEPTIALQLAATGTYPADGDVVNCGRCGSPVVRAHPHVVYAVVTTLLSDGLDVIIGNVLHDVDFVVLCPECELPDNALDRRAVGLQPETERLLKA